jgi:ATPase subunit of ABC transporter with duplicated ATPase domains
MIAANNLSIQFGKRILFKDVNVKFTPGNCYGIIGANGAGKSTFIKILSGKMEPTSGNISIETGKRMAVLEQDQFKYDEEKVLETVIMGHNRLFELMKEREELYSKTEFTEEEGNRIGEVEAEFAEINGYEAESEAATLLNGLGLGEEFMQKKMSDLEGGEKVRVLLAQSLFGNPDVLLLDEPTNNLDIKSIEWLEEFLYKFNNTVLVVSHDRHFLNKVCTHITDIDFAEMRTYAGNYSFWQQAAQLAMKQKKDQQKKSEDKASELKDFISRFSANASKARQATSRKKQLEKLNLDDLPKTSRRFPYIEFKAERECGNIVLDVHNLNKSKDGEVLLKDLSISIGPGDKVAVVSENDRAVTTFFDIITEKAEADSGEFNWGVTIKNAYMPKENNEYFLHDTSLVNWLRQYSPESDETFIRGFLGRMLFSQDEANKSSTVLSGGEKMRCMLSKTMLSSANTLILDDPTNHLDLEAITSLNNAMIAFDQTMLFTSHDHQLLQSTATRVLEITPNGIIDKICTYDEYIHSEEIQAKRQEMYELV